MYHFEITANEAGQRLDKYLKKLLPKAPSSFFYKMLRKKNIVVNGKKAEGGEKLSVGDRVSLFLSMDTFAGFCGEENEKKDGYEDAYGTLKGIGIVCENKHMLLLNKPAGILTQKACETDLSLNEWLVGYLLSTGAATRESLKTYRPSVCNRLDRNTSGLVICAKSLAGSQRLNELIRERRIRKFYRLYVKGVVREEGVLSGYLSKDARTNTVAIAASQTARDSREVLTRYYPVKNFSDITCLEAELVTGKTHQIRAHMALAGHPLVGDAKYGDAAFNEKFKKKYQLHYQLLHAFRLEFPADGLLLKEAESFTAKEPAVFERISSSYR